MGFDREMLDVNDAGIQVRIAVDDDLTFVGQTGTSRQKSCVERSPRVKTEIKLVSNRGKYSFKLNDFQKKSVADLMNTIK